LRQTIVILITLLSFPCIVNAEPFFFEEDSEINIEYEGDELEEEEEQGIVEKPVIISSKEIKLFPIFGLSIFPKGELSNRPWSFL